jgi:hypothetical protein
MLKKGLPHICLSVYVNYHHHFMNELKPESLSAVTSQWLRIGLFNLALVALVGLLMRYNIAYSLPLLQQKNMLHAHSHFAFAGWISHSIIVMMTACMSRASGVNYFPRYRVPLIANLLTAYAMLIAFIMQGYALFSIVFSTLSVFVSWWYSVMFWKDLSRLKTAILPARVFKAALVFNVISAAGPFFLAYMMITKTATTDRYLSSIYYYLHFQYNGWFFFGCLTLFLFWLSGSAVSFRKYNIAFILFAAACIPAYFLSLLWLDLPSWFYGVVSLSALAQVIAGFLLVASPAKEARERASRLPGAAKLLLILAAIALSLKLVLQLGSAVPALSHLAFGSRPVIIGYLHLVLLGIITFFLLGFGVANYWLHTSQLFKAGLYTFIAGIVLNELMLMIQGIAALKYYAIPYANHLLLAIAFLMFAGALLVYLSQRKRKPGSLSS